MRKKQGIILKEGESTGHAHRAMGDVSFNKQTKKLLLAEKEIEVQHKEHEVVPVIKDSTVGDVVEFDPITEELRRIQD